MLTSCGGFGPGAQKYFKHIYGRARGNSCSDMGVGQPDIQTTWNTPQASTYWNMRLSVAGAAKDAQVSLSADRLVFVLYFAHITPFVRTSCSATSPAISSWSAGSLIPIPSRHTCRRGALIALLWRLRMPLAAPPGALSHFLLDECLWFSSCLLLRLWLLLAFARPFLPLGL